MTSVILTAEAEKEGKTESFEEKYKDILREDVMKYLSDNRAHRALLSLIHIYTKKKHVIQNSDRKRSQEMFLVSVMMR